jgi:hypothetical protein
MKKITKYVSNDGKEFAKQAECLKYEEQAKKIATIMKDLPARPKDTDFSNGKGYIQHKKTVFNRAKKRLIVLAADLFNIKGLKKEKPENVHPHSIVGRYIGDSGNYALNDAWYRIMCTDTKYREWGQPYYTTHPTEGDLRQLNK